MCVRGVSRCRFVWRREKCSYRRFESLMQAHTLQAYVPAQTLIS
jgi:hypothetical protein